MKSSIIFLLSLIACSVSGKEHKVKKVVATEIAYYKNKHDKTKKCKQLSYFIVYDTQGREIEYGTYGQTTCHTFVNTDSSKIKFVCVGSSHDYSKIFDVDFTTYDKDGKIIKTEIWVYRNNEKDWLLDSTQYLYLGSRLFHTATYNDSNKIERTSTYLYDSIGNKIATIDSEFDNNNNKWSIEKTIYQYDNTNKILNTKKYYNKKILRREQFIYDKDSDKQVTKFSYFDEDTIPTLITDDYYELSYGSFKEKKLVEEYEKYIGSYHTHSIYYYNKYGFKKRIEQFNGVQINNYVSFKYQYYPNKSIYGFKTKNEY